MVKGLWGLFSLGGLIQTIIFCTVVDVYKNSAINSYSMTKGC